MKSKWSVFSVLAVVTLLAAVCCAGTAFAGQPSQPPKPSPEHLKLQLWFGEWTYEGENQTTFLGPGGKFNGRMTGRPIMDGFGAEYVFVENGPSGEIRTVEIDCYDPVAKNYPYISISSDGSFFQGSFTMNGNVATWEGTSVVNGRRFKDRGTDAVTSDGMSITKRGEISEDGKTWVPSFAFKATKVRRELKIFELWKQDLRKESKLDPDLLIKNFLAETSFTPAIKKWTPDLLDEVRGIAEGSGQPFETVFAFQLGDEIWVFLEKRAANRCSAMGVAKSGSHPAYIAQNMDLEAFRDGFQVVLHIAGNESIPEQFVFTSAGLIGVNGINDHSIAITCNTLLQLSASSDGLPVAFIVRGVLAQTNGEEALKFIRSIKHASGQNYILGVWDRVYDFEASAEKVVEYRPLADGSVVYHTNHRLVNNDLKPSWSAASEEGLVNSKTRFASVQARLGRPASAIDEGVIKETLRSKDSELYPVCRTLKAGADSFTFGATIMTLSGAPSFEVTMGPPDVNLFVRLEFSTVAGHSKSADPPGRKAAESPRSSGVVMVRGMALPYLTEGPGIPCLVTGYSTLYESIFSDELKRHFQFILVDWKNLTCPR